MANLPGEERADGPAGPRPITSNDEISHYDKTASEAVSRAYLIDRVRTIRATASNYSGNNSVWLDTHFDSVAQAEIMSHVAPLIRGGTVLQVGGTGLAVLKAVIGGAERGILVTPSQGELDLLLGVADELGMRHSISGTVGFAEALPFEDATIDVVLSEGCLHHTDVGQALTEIKRVLRGGGRLGTFDPWHARLYDVGIKVFGKRDPRVDCRPLNPERVRQLSQLFPASDLRLHGPVTRYPLVALHKLRVPVSREMVHRVMLIDDKLSRASAALRRNGSSAAILATK